MSAILFVRHGPTAWNRQGLIQGQSDIPLSEEGRAEVRRWSLRAEFRTFDWYSSPLARAHETALLLGAVNHRHERRLMEAHWGEWEGWSLDQLRRDIGEVFAAMEAKGLDLLPPGGESPRMVRARLAEWLAEMAPQQRPIVAVCHAGVVRAAYSLATGWDMKKKAPLARPHAFAHLYDLAPDGRIAVVELNIPLLAPDEPDPYDPHDG
ncbi:MAG: histidine phosphatase family protein [Rhodospirillaceae bacterium]|nr:histidine phosphatase family protein [Rhodospirillaceae bacterium]